MSKEISEAAMTKFNEKVEKLVLSLGGEVGQATRFLRQWSLKTTAGKLLIGIMPHTPSSVFSIYCKFEDTTKANEARTAGKLPHSSELNQHSGKWNFHSTKEKKILEDFTTALKKIAIKGIDITYTVRIKSEKNPSVFIEGQEAGVVEKRVVTLFINEADLESPSIQMYLFQLKDQIRDEWFEIGMELGNTIKPKKNGKAKTNRK